MKKTIYCPDIECDSCVRMLEKVLGRAQGIRSTIIKKDSIDVEYDEALLNPEALLPMIHEKGYRAAFTPFPRKSFKERAREFVENKTKYEVEYRMLKYMAISFFLLLGIEALLYFSSFKNIPSFFTLSGIWILFLTISIVALTTALWHFKTYKTEMTCMVGMMTGMTIGMQSGLLLGVVLGATNGMFVGGLVSMLAATAVGWYAGKCCGIMGILEGIMAGIMGSTMGAMISVMLLSNHLLLFMPFFLALNLLVLFGFSYMLFEEVVENSPALEKAPVAFFTFFSSCFLLTFLFSIIILYGPKTGVIWLG